VNQKGLEISAKIGRRIYAKWKKVPEAEFKMINLRQHGINQSGIIPSPHEFKKLFCSMAVSATA
jgi:hypothetical protein